MPARYDKYEPKVGNHRAPLNANLAKTTTLPIAVGLNTSGQVVVGAGNAGITGLLVITKDMKAGDIVDVMKHGEIVGCEGLTAGTRYTANTTTGVVSSAAESGTQIAVGHTVEAARLIVEVAQ